MSSLLTVLLLFSLCQAQVKSFDIETRFSCSIFEMPTSGSHIIGSAQINKSCKIIGKYGDFYKVIYGDITGFMLTICFPDTTLDGLENLSREIEQKMYEAMAEVREVNKRSAIKRGAKFDSLKSVETVVGLNVKIYDKPDSESPVIYTTTHRLSALIDWIKGDFAHVSTCGAVGWAGIYQFSDDLINGEKFSTLRDRCEKAEASARYKKLVNKFGSTAANKITKRLIWLGMTDEMAIESWGVPNDINRTVGAWGVHEQWVYSLGTYLYFENGKLTSWQD